jgi:hypothetical protein
MISRQIDSPLGALKPTSRNLVFRSPLIPEALISSLHRTIYQPIKQSQQKSWPPAKQEQSTTNPLPADA